MARSEASVAASSPTSAALSPSAAARRTSFRGSRRMALSTGGLDGSGSLRGSRHDGTHGPLRLGQKLQHVEGLPNHPEAVKLVLHLLVHGPLGIEPDDHGDTGNDRLEEVDQV